MKKRINIVIAILLILLAGCRSAKKETMVTSDMQKIEMNSGVITPQLTGGNPASTSPVVYIYKTKADYSHQVPVMMNEARTRILSYPAPGDLKMGDVPFRSEKEGKAALGDAGISERELNAITWS